MGEDIGLRVHPAERLYDFLSASHPDKPIMYDRNAHRAIQSTKLIEVADELVMNAQLLSTTRIRVSNMPVYRLRGIIFPKNKNR